MKKLFRKLKDKKEAFVLATIIGNISPPPVLIKYDTTSPQGLFTFLGIIIKVLIGGAGLFVLFNLIIAGYGFISAGGNSEAVGSAWAKIWQSLLGLVIVAGSIVIAGVVGLVIFKDPTALLVPKLYGPE